ncbi:hypothetical protein AB1E18_013933 [Capra hircus]
MRSSRPVQPVSLALPASRYTLRDERLNFPGGSVAKNLPANAGDPGFTLLQEISRAGEPRNPCAAPAEPARPRAGLRKRGSLR